MEIPQYYKRERVTPSAGNVPMSMGDINQATSGDREIARLGEAMTNVGLAYMDKQRRVNEELAQKKEQAEYYDQLNTAKTAVLKEYFEFKKNLRNNLDTSTWEKSIQDFHSILPNKVKFTNPRAQTEFEPWLEQQKLIELQDVYGDKTQIDIRNHVDSLNKNIENTAEMAINASTEQSYQMSVADGTELYGMRLKEGGQFDKAEDYEKIKGWDNPTFKDEEWQRAGLKGWLNRVVPQRQKLVYEQGQQNIQGIAQQMIDAGKEIPDVQKFIDTQKLSPEDKLSQYGHAATYYNAKKLQTKQESDSIQIQMLMNLEKNKAADPVERNRIANKSLLQLSQVKNLSRADFVATKKQIDDYREGKATGSDTDTSIEAAGIIEDVRRGLLTEYAATNKLNSLRPKLDSKDFEKYSTSLTTKLTDRDLEFVNNTVEDFGKTYPAASTELTYQYRDKLEDYINSETGKKASPRDRHIRQAEIAAEVTKPAPSHFWSNLVNTIPIVAAGKILSARSKLKEAQAKQAEVIKKKVGDIVSKGGKDWKVTGFTPEGKTIVEEVK